VTTTPAGSVENFGPKYIGDAEQASQPGRTEGSALGQPLLVLKGSWYPPPLEPCRYLLPRGCPLMLIPLISLEVWLP